MKIVFLQTGKTKSRPVESLAAEYYKRLRRYTNFEEQVIPDLKNTKNMNEDEVCRQEGSLIMKEIQPSDHLVLLDEKGRSYTSVKFADHLQKIMNRGVRRLVFVIGGPYGFSDEVYQRADEKISLSDMTFSHQIIRAIFAEQLYRAFSILNNDPYHHQ